LTRSWGALTCLPDHAFFLRLAGSRNRRALSLLRRTIDRTAAPRCVKIPYPVTLFRRRIAMFSTRGSINLWRTGRSFSAPLPRSPRPSGLKIGGSFEQPVGRMPRNAGLGMDEPGADLGAQDISCMFCTKVPVFLSYLDLAVVAEAV
jgi:hypothetical protein